MKLEAHAAVAVTGAVVIARAGLPPRFGVSTDTRSLVPGDAFVALRGERFDGHAFVAEAVGRGAGVLVVEDASAVPDGIAALVVADTKAAYLALGALARRDLRARIVALTGSTGKTTTRAFLAQMLANVAPGRVAATAKNENNEIGVAKSLLAIEPEATYAVLELGARHYGEIAPLVRAVAPDVALLTNVGDAHLEIMGSPERLAQTKWEIFSTGAAAVLNVADPTSRAWASRLSAPPTWFALDDESGGDALAARIVTLRGRERLRVRDAAGVREYDCNLTVAGDHNRRNAVAAAAAAVALGVAARTVAIALHDLTLPQGRYERLALHDGEAIYDAYNASMSGTLATVNSFAAEAASRRIAVLASMAELGPDAAAMHAKVGAAAAGARLSALLVGGEFAADLARGARDAGYDPARIVPFADNAAATQWLRRNLRQGDLVLFKGSRRYRLEEVVTDLQGVHA
ncbi:MAG: UDP-N-acetylmuramoyl-tripeptide--D-alanyl-D-alanine ligase [Candidatus Eremiobacteraeota bacterium]|nr:UDP-N-acetylmuramoyl-tripeptide--D-alanyl-D-alanine ligase [Candidatus Eremiobacteraeota bacterium]MBC5803490.1 UDP-N-acetylmuramoyl-tripeptide--D-alanyl-D-alanine ligase [Candidatus Eremiobacteraeota bacterium]MBC5820465.1 UDP-N-acetylmuramoyl-tripeptide--D-alanyl-D-alanine ligase [Candidatus Eremiobacteraeota bacterium]